MEPLRMYHLQTHKVTSINTADRMPKIESILVKLDSTHSLHKYCLFLKQDGVIESNPPTIKAVFINGKDAGKEEIFAAQHIVDEILKPESKKLSYKEAFEDQEKKTIELAKRLAALETKKETSESPVIDSTREQLEDKANELNITFRSNLGNEKLLLKIQDIEPEFEI